MDEEDRETFRLFCENATDSQLCEIVKQERERAAQFGGVIYTVCAAISAAVAHSRGIDGSGGVGCG